MNADRLLLVTILLLAVLLRVAFLPLPYSSIGHTLGNLDEASALAYITHLAIEKNLLIDASVYKALTKYDLPIYSQSIMAYHPPLYYFLGAALLLVTMPLALPQQILVLKLFSVLLGVAGILLTYYLLRDIFPGFFPLAVAFFLSVWPTHIYFSTTLNNYALVLFLYPLFALLLFRGWQKGFDFQRVALVALLAGLLALTHFPTLTSIPLALVVIALRQGKQAPKTGLAFLAMFLLFAGAFFLFYKQVYGEYLPTPLNPELLGYMAGNAPTYFTRLFIYFFNLFEAHVDFPKILYYLLVPFTLASLAGLLHLFLQFKKLPTIQRAFLASGLVAIAVMVFWQLYYEGTVSPNGYHGRRLFELMPFPQAFFLLGLKEVAEKTKCSPKLVYLPLYLIFLGFIAYYYFF